MLISNLGLKFDRKNVLWPFLRMRTKSDQSGQKRGQIGKNSGSVRKRGQRT